MVALVVSLLTLFALALVWMGAFWSPPEADENQPVRSPAETTTRGRFLMLAPTAVLVACSLAVAAAAGPIYAFSERTARDLVDRDVYIDQVLQR